MCTTQLSGRTFLPKFRWLGSLALIGVVFAATSGAAHAQNVFWTDLDTKSVFRADLGAGTRTTIFQKTTGFVGAPGLAFDAPSRQLYWISDGSIYQSNVDGSQIDAQAISENPFNPSALSPDLSGRLGRGGPKLYFGGDEEFFQVNPDGSDFSQLFRFNDDPIVENLAIDFEQGRFYWSSHGS